MKVQKSSVDYAALNAAIKSEIEMGLSEANQIMVAVVNGEEIFVSANQGSVPGWHRVPGFWPVENPVIKGPASPSDCAWVEAQVEAEVAA